MPFPAIKESQNRFAVDASNLLFQYLDTVGDGTGTTAMTGNYSVTPQEFLYLVPANKQATIERLIVEISDNGNFSAAGYGAGVALTNGIHLSIHDENDVQILLLTPELVKTNAGWAGVAFNLNYIEFGNGDNNLVARWDFSGAGSPLVLKAGHKIHADLSDNFSGLLFHRMMIQGYTLDVLD